MCYPSYNDETWHSYALPKAHMVPILGSADFLDAMFEKKYFSKILKISLIQKVMQHLLCSCAKAGDTAAQKMKFSIKDFFSKCEEIRSFL